MIKTGIVGGATTSAARLMRLLLHHPDVDLRWVCDAGHAGMRVADVHPSLVGDTDVTFSEQPDWVGVDVTFLCDDSANDDIWLEQIPADVRVIDLSTRFRLIDEQLSGFVYGMSETNRRRMVHDCMRVTCPGELTMALALALIPLARNLMLNSELHATVVVGKPEATTGSHVQLVHTGSYSNQIDELHHVLGSLQSSFASAIHLTAMEASFERGMLATVYFKSGIDAAMARELYERYYDDHNFTYVVNQMPRPGDVAGTNKCLIYITREGEYLRVTSVIDQLIKGAVGTAVHAMNLMFGLHERVGLML